MLRKTAHKRTSNLSWKEKLCSYHKYFAFEIVEKLNVIWRKNGSCHGYFNPPISIWPFPLWSNTHADLNTEKWGLILIRGRNQ